MKLITEEKVYFAVSWKQQISYPELLQLIIELKIAVFIMRTMILLVD